MLVLHFAHHFYIKSSMYPVCTCIRTHVVSVLEENVKLFSYKAPGNALNKNHWKVFPHIFTNVGYSYFLQSGKKNNCILAHCFNLYILKVICEFELFLGLFIMWIAFAHVASATSWLIYIRTSLFMSINVLFMIQIFFPACPV